MRQVLIKVAGLGFGLVLAAGLIFMVRPAPVEANRLSQDATSMIATVTGTPSGPMAVVVPGNESQVNLRNGPGIFFDKVGVLLVGQKVPALGRSPAGEWYQVEYPGVPGGKAWIFYGYIKIEPDVQLPVVENPPTPTPLVSATVDPTLAAKFIITTAPTRLPTYTPPPPLSIPTFRADGGASVGGVPMGFVILGLAAVGFLVGLIAFAQGR